jgi:hypothetical protein
MEVEPMETTIKDAIKKMVKRTGDLSDTGDSMRLSQAALNLAHVAATFANIEDIKANTERMKKGN